MSETAAGDITVLQAIGLLDSDFEGLAKGVAKGQYAFWIGSAISRDRLDDLKGVVQRVLEHLRANIDHTNPICYFKSALDQALILAALPDRIRESIQYAQEVLLWPDIDTILKNISSQYAMLLDVKVHGKESDYLLWDVVDVPNTFSPENAMPDCEHICLAILCLEGVLPDVVSANWDGLIETAVDKLTESDGSALRVCVVPEDIRKVDLLSRLFKFHGCAVRAGLDPDVYRRLLIARQSQITTWHSNNNYRFMKRRMIALAASKPTIMVGLSAQDQDIQRVFEEAREDIDWEWPSDPPAHVFTEETLGVWQRNILSIVYRDAYENNVIEVEDGALFRAYAKPALTALVLHVLCSKLREFLSHIDAPSLEQDVHVSLGDGIKHIRNLIAMGAEPNRYEFIQTVTNSLIIGMSLFQTGRLPTDNRYRAISRNAIHLIQTDVNIETNGMREFAAVLGVIGFNVSEGMWRATAVNLTRPDSAMMTLVVDGRSTRILFAANQQASIRFSVEGIVDDDDEDVVVVHSLAQVQPAQRSPSGDLGRRGLRSLRNVSMANILLQARSLEDINQQFRMEALL